MISGNGKRLTLILLLLLMFLATRSKSKETCSVDEKTNVSLVSVHLPARVIKILDNETTTDACYERCCQYRETDGELCTAVSTYTNNKIRVCVLLHCVPFKNCSWKTMDGYYAARIAHKSLQSTTPTTLLTTTTTATSTTTETSIETDSQDWNVIEPTSSFYTTQPTSLAPFSDSQTSDQLDQISNDKYSEIGKYKFSEFLPSTSDNTIDDYDGDDDNAGDGIDNDREPIDDKQITTHRPFIAPETSIVKVNDLWKDDDSSIFNLSTPDMFYVIVAVVAIITTMLALSIIAFKKFNRRNRQYRSLRDYNVRVETPSTTSLLQRDS